MFLEILLSSGSLGLEFELPAVDIGSVLTRLPQWRATSRSLSPARSCAWPLVLLGSLRHADECPTLSLLAVLSLAHITSRTFSRAHLCGSASHSPSQLTEPLLQLPRFQLCPKTQTRAEPCALGLASMVPAREEVGVSKLASGAQDSNKLQVVSWWCCCCCRGEVNVGCTEPMRQVYKLCDWGRADLSGVHEALNSWG